MNPLEYKFLMENLIEDFTKKKQELQQKYVDSNAKFKVGDFIENVCGIIKVEEIDYTMSFDIPHIVYKGTAFRKEKGKLIKTKQKTKKILNEYGGLKKIDLKKWKL